MKKLLIALLAVLCLTGCSSAPKAESTMYIVAGWYYTCGKVITEDGNIWGYNADGFENEQPISVVFNDMGTPDYIYDDEIVMLIK